MSVVRQASPDPLRNLIASRMLIPYPALESRVGAERHAAYSLAQGEAAWRAATGAFALIESNRAVAAGAWRHLPWDSGMFGFPAGRLEMLVASGSYQESRLRAQQVLASVVSDCAHQGIRHLTARVDTRDYAALHTLQAAGFELIDGIQTFGLPVTGEISREFPEGTRLFDSADLDAVVEIGRTSFLYDRFHNDPFLPKAAADYLHGVWTENCCLGKAADAVIVTEREGRIAGYATVKVDAAAKQGLGISIATIILVATAGWARRSGCARDVTLGTLAWCAREQVETVEVGTQISNVPAGRAYEARGFRLSGVSLTLRKVFT